MSAIGESGRRKRGNCWNCWKRKKEGFTLVEIITGLAIITILSAILIPITKTLQQSVHKHVSIAP
ncbi:prepilin-type N-terminal cleavage/methylation domain-containing protein [bacterium]|nr:prepilin-type N-terminal cleavage/methylation domain-containing protein [bacterium]